MKTCEVCGTQIFEQNMETKPCPTCGRMRCQTCDMGAGTECETCENEEDPGDLRYSQHGDYPS